MDNREYLGKTYEFDECYDKTERIGKVVGVDTTKDHKYVLLVELKKPNSESVRFNLAKCSCDEKYLELIEDFEEKEGNLYDWFKREQIKEELTPLESNVNFLEEPQSTLKALCDFSIGDDVYDTLNLDVGRITDITDDKDFPIVVQFENGNNICYMADGGIRSDKTFSRRICKLGEDCIIKSPSKPMKTFESLLGELKQCEKEWVKGEENIQLFLNYAVDCNVVDYYSHDTWRLPLTYYKFKAVAVMHEINKLGYFSQFEKWYLEKNRLERD